MSFKSTEASWIPPIKGEYCPPPQEIYKNVICRTIKTSNYIDRHISHFIGKDGRQFIEWTKEYHGGILYYYEVEYHISEAMRPFLRMHVSHFNLNDLQIIINEHIF